MNYNEYQIAAMRTCSIPNKYTNDMIVHGVTGLISELAEIEEVLGENWNYVDKDHLKKEVGDCTWMIAEIYTAMNWNMDMLLDQTEEYMQKHMLIQVIGKLSGLVQKQYQGHQVDRVKLMAFMEAVFSHLLNLCYRFGFTMEEVMEANIVKLRKRYPDGFDAERSLNRAEGDI